jgi:predicted acyl esterase
MSVADDVEVVDATPSAEVQWPPRLNAAPAPEAVTAWFDYERPPTFECVEETVRIPMRDGIELVGRLYRPGRDGAPDEVAHPGIVSEYTPYALEEPHRPLRARYLAERGFNVLLCNVRGSGDSGGTFVSWLSPEEAEDNYELIEWFAAQPYCTGDVAQIGDSYGSVTCYRVAALKPPSLRTIVPVVSPTDMYGACVYPGGVPSSMGAWWASLAPVLDDEARASTLASFQDNPVRNDFWKQISTIDKLKDVDVPVLHIGGYFDVFRRGGFEVVRERPEGTWLLQGPWVHYHTVVSTPEEIFPDWAPITPGPLSYGAVLHWLDYWLSQTPGTEVPPARIVSFESTSDEARGRWIALDHWPPAGTQQRLYPVPAGSLSETPPADGVTRYAVNPGDGPSVDLMGSVPWSPAQDQGYTELSDRRPNGRYQLGRVTFTLPAWAEDTVISGPVELHLRASITAADTFFVSKLETVLPDGRVLPIEHGYLRAQLRSSFEREETVPAGTALDYSISLGDIHWRFSPGEQLRVSLSAGDVPLVLPLAPAGIVTVHHGEGTYLTVRLAALEDSAD